MGAGGVSVGGWWVNTAGQCRSVQGPGMFWLPSEDGLGSVHRFEMVFRGQMVGPYGTSAPLHTL